jgi:pyruvate, water dikinase
MDDMLGTLEKVYGHPLDTEFTGSVGADGRVQINLLQCRPMRTPGSDGSVPVPVSIPSEQILFKSNRIINGGTISDIRYILYIDPERYAMVESMDIKKSLGRIVGLLNEHPLMIQGKMILMGPGRWGSSNIDLGVNVSYADINHASVLVEIAREETGHVPEVSYGTHFFLDLIEAQIIYMPVYPSDPESCYHHAFFRDSVNILPKLLPDAVKFQELIRVIDLSETTKGKYGNVAADPQKQKAICFLK